VVLKLKPDLAGLAALSHKLNVAGIKLFGAHDNEAAGIEVRTFAPAHAIDEDPVCGSGNGSVAEFQWNVACLVPMAGNTPPCHEASPQHKFLICLPIGMNSANPSGWPSRHQ
jgi:Phenazine biosynthesis-like protein